MTEKNSCRRCKKPLKIDPVELEEAEEEMVLRSPTDKLTLATGLVLYAHRGEMTQRELGNLVGNPRTYISKIERQHMTPTILMLEQFAGVFGMPMWKLIHEIECLARIFNQMGL